jgi:HlyD family secretion protein
LTRIGQVAAALVVLAAILVWLPGWVRPTIARAAVRTATVTAGPIEEVISASGTIVPEVERALSSPLDARVLRILKRPGDRVRLGDPLVELDTSESALAVDKLEKDLAVKDNEQAQTRLTLEKSLVEVEGQIDTKKLDLATYRAQLENDRQLLKEGLTSRDKLRLSELAEAKAVIELRQLEGQRDNVRRANSTQIDGLRIQRGALVRETTQARRQLELATTRADRDGVVTWSLTEEGIAVHKGDVIARIADLRTFRVDATVSDIHLKTLAPAMPVIVRISDADTLSGHVMAVYPKIDNGVITFTAGLDDKSSALLRPNLRVDVLVVTARKARTLRLKKGPFSEGDGYRQAFVIRGGRAIRTPIGLGLASFDQFEVVSGLVEGDEVIISDMREYLHLQTVNVR